MTCYKQFGCWYKHNKAHTWAYHQQLGCMAAIPRKVMEGFNCHGEELSHMDGLFKADPHSQISDISDIFHEYLYAYLCSLGQIMHYVYKMYK